MPKTIRFEFFHTIAENIDDPNVKRPIDLGGMFAPIANGNYQIQTTRECFGDRARIQRLEYNAEHSYWKILLLRLRNDASIPGLANDDGRYELIRLPEGQTFAEAICAIYMPQNSILYMERNRNGLPPSGVEEYFNRASTAQRDYRINLEPIRSARTIDRITNLARYRKIEFSLTMPQVNIDPNVQGSLHRIIDIYSGLHCKNISGKLSIGHNRDAELSTDEAAELIYQLYRYNDINMLKVNMIPEGRITPEKVDLLNDIMHYFQTFEYSRENPITYDRIMPRMEEDFLRGLERLR